MGLAVVRRVVRRRPVFQGDRHHIHHRLVDLGLTPGRAVVTLYGVAAVFAALALAMATGPRMVVWASGALVVLLVWLGVRALGYWEVTAIQRTFLARLESGFQASDDAALRGLEHDLEQLGDFDLGWARLCETAWALELMELKLDPERLVDLAGGRPNLMKVAQVLAVAHARQRPGYWARRRLR